MKSEKEKTERTEQVSEKKKNSLSRELVLYIIFGILTTAVNIGVQYAVSFCFGLNDAGKVWIANPIAWVAGVLFAYVTNRLFVFRSQARGLKAVAAEAGEFFLARFVTLLFDQLVMWLLVGRYWGLDRFVSSLLHMGLEQANNLDAKLISNVIVIILNYVFSKLIIFRAKKGPKKD